LLRQLADRFGPALQPGLAAAPLIATPAMTGWPYVNGVLTASGAQWYVAERPTGSAEDPGADATVYRWSGSAWLKQGVVDHVPASLNYFQASGRFKAVTAPGTADPGFLLRNGVSSHSEVLTNAGGD
jgi:hypothetical protein